MFQTQSKFRLKISKIDAKIIIIHPSITKINLNHPHDTYSRHAPLCFCCKRNRFQATSERLQFSTLRFWSRARASMFIVVVDIAAERVHWRAPQSEVYSFLSLQTRRARWTHSWNYSFAASALFSIARTHQLDALSALYIKCCWPLFHNSRRQTHLMYAAGKLLFF